MTKKELAEFLIKNFTDKNGNLNLRFLDFSHFNGNVYIDNMKVKNDLDQSDQTVHGDLNQSQQFVSGDLSQTYHYVEGDLYQYAQTVEGNLYQNNQKVKGEITND